MAHQKNHLIYACFFLLFFSISSIASAQFSISGYLTNENKEPLTFASIVLLQKSDSSIVAFGLSNEKGKYIIDVKDQGNYLLQYSFLGYRTQYQALTTDWQNSTIELDPITMKEADIQLSEVSVEADRIPMKMIGDTIQYDAKAFKVAEGSDVEKLLEKMPGIEIDADGNVTAYGKKVEKILVDGKEFFGNDPKMATKNLEAKAIDKVEVLDKKSKKAEFTGVDDGEEQKTINLTLKEEFKKGGFGRIIAGVGTEDTYKGKLNYNRFNEETQASVILNANNINERPFSWQEYTTFSGDNSWNNTTGNLINGIGGNEGINDAISSGINFTHEFSEKVEMKAFYYLTKNDKHLTKFTQSDNFFKDTLFTTLADHDNNVDQINHSVNLELEWEIDSMTEIEYEGSGIFSQESYLNSTFTTYIPSNETTNFTTNNNDIDLDNLSNNHQLVFQRKFNKAKRNMSVSGNYSSSTQENNTNIDNLVFGDRILQYQRYDENQQQTGFTASYTEPLDSVWLISGSYEYTSSIHSPTRLFYDIQENESQVLNSELSTVFTREVDENKGVVTFRRNKKNLSMRMGASAIDVNLQANTIQRNFQYLLPFFYARYRLKGSQNFNFRYSMRYNLPSLQQLVTIPDNRNSNTTFIGNPNLTPETTHSININYYYFNPATSTNNYLGGNINFTNHNIVNRVIINSDFTRFTTPQNSGSATNINFWAGISKPIKKLKIKMGIHPWGGVNNYSAFINTQPSQVNSTDLNVRLTMQRIKKEKWDVVLGVNYGVNYRTFEANSTFNQDLTNYGWFARGEYDISKSLQLEIDYNLDRFAKTSFAPSREFHRLNASIRKSIKDDLWAFSLVANDILNVNEGISRSGDATSLYYSQYNTRAQYFMLLIERSLGKNKNEKKGRGWRNW